MLGKKKVAVELGHQQNEEQVITHHLCFQSRSSLPAVDAAHEWLQFELKI